MCRPTFGACVLGALTGVVSESDRLATHPYMQEQGCNLVARGRRRVPLLVRYLVTWLLWLIR